MKIIWNQEQTIAIPYNNIKSFEINHRSNGKGDLIFYVVAHYTILSGLSETLYEAYDKGSCIEFIDQIIKDE